MKFAAALFVLITLCALPAHAQVLCFSHDRVVQYLAQTFSETPVGVGLATTGGLVEVFASKAGTWTIVITAPSGVSCMGPSGEGWTNLADSVSAKGQTS